MWTVTDREQALGVFGLLGLESLSCQKTGFSHSLHWDTLQSATSVYSITYALPTPAPVPRFPASKFSGSEPFDVLPGAEPGRVKCSRVLSKGGAENGEHRGWVYKWKIQAELCWGIGWWPAWGAANQLSKAANEIISVKNESAVRARVFPWPPAQHFPARDGEGGRSLEQQDPHITHPPES